MKLGFLLSLLLITTSSMILKRHYRRPICEPSQTCSYRYLESTFDLCDCPDMKACPTENGVVLKGITYQFCSARDLPLCSPNEIAAEVNVLQTSIYCICPANQIYMKHEDAKYICQEKKVCVPGQMCGVGNPMVGIKKLCSCSQGHRCVLSDVFEPLSVQNATCQPVR